MTSDPVCGMERSADSASVRSNPLTPAESELRGRVADLVQLARQRGYTRADLVKMVADAP
jgi:hypothetical protein